MACGRTAPEAGSDTGAAAVPSPGSSIRLAVIQYQTTIATSRPAGISSEMIAPALKLSANGIGGISSFLSSDRDRGPCWDGRVDRDRGPGRGGRVDRDRGPARYSPGV